MKIMVFNGSPKRDESDTLHMTRAFLEGMEQAAPQNVNLIHVIDRHIESVPAALPASATAGPAATPTI